MLMLYGKNVIVRWHVLRTLSDNGASPEHILNVSNKIALLQYDIKEACLKRLDSKEQKAVETAQS